MTEYVNIMRNQRLQGLGYNEIFNTAEWKRARIIAAERSR